MVIIERFEGDVAILEPCAEIKRGLLPKNAREGDVIVLQNGVWSIDSEATSARREKIVGRLRKMGL
jgi:hypothetical protein